jgi:translation elongation factor EF-1alpha
VIEMAKKDLVGKVIHYYDKIGVAVIKLQKSLKVEDKVRFEKGDMSFEQIIESMQLEHEPISEGKKGQDIAVKVDKVIKKDVSVYKV